MIPSSHSPWHPARPLLALALALGGCGETAPETATEIKPPTVTTPAPEATPEAGAVTKTAVVATPKEVPAPTQDLPSPSAPAPAPEAEDDTADDAADTGDPVQRFARALTRIKDCERANGGLFVAKPEACFATLKKTRKALTHPTATDPADRDRLAQGMARTLEDALSHEELTVVYYALLERPGHFRASAPLLDRLREFMGHLSEPIAEAAAIVRFGLEGVPAAETKQMAVTTFGEHAQRRVRLAACRHLGSAPYKGDRKVFKLLVDTAKDGEADLLLRSCAARTAGHVATERQLKTLIGLLDTPEIQQPVIVGLQRGLASPKAFDAYVRWFERQASTPDKIHWTAIHAFLPWDAELDRMPRERSIRVLVGIAGNTKHLTKVRTVAIEGLRRLKAEAAVAELAKQLGSDDAPELLQLLGR